VALSKIALDDMTIHPAWAGSLATMNSLPMKKVILDEIRLMPLETGNESNAIKQSADRLTTYKALGLAQAYGVSTPSIEGDLLHQQLSVPGTTVLRWAVKCFNCGKIQVLDFFKQVHFDEQLERAVCRCSSCGVIFEDSDKKKKLNSTGFYVESGSLEPVQIDKLKSNRLVFWYDSMNSPSRSFHAIWTEFTQTKDKVQDYKNFIQCWLARFWINDISKTSVSNLRKLFVEEPLRIVPEWTKVITAGVDTQDSGFYVVVRAFGAARKSRVLDAFYIHCSMHVADAETIKEKLEHHIENAVFSDLKGNQWKIALWAIDTGGHRTKQVYKANKYLNRVIQVKGSSHVQLTTIKYNSEINLYLVKTAEYLEETEELSQIGGGSFEIPATISDDYLVQWVNKRKVKEKNKKTGEEKVIWKNVGQCDYRMADIHSFICLDIPTDVGTFRSELEKDEFRYNPFYKMIKSEDTKSRAEVEAEVEQSSSYDIGTFSEGW
jgi:phage terminase large subunit GpA-like protein